MASFEPPHVSAESLRKMLHFIATDLGLDDPYEMSNAVTLTRKIREAISDLQREENHE